MSDSSAVKKSEPLVAEPIVVICAPGKVAPVVIAPLEKQVQETKGVDFKRTQTIQGATALAQKSKKVVAILCVSDKSELMSALTFLASVSSRVSVGTVRVMMINKISHPKIPLMLKDKGASEVLDYTVNQKAISFKINTYLKLVHQAYEKKLKSDARLPIHKGSLGGSAKGASSKMGLSKASDAGAEIVWKKPLSFESDIWLVNSKKDVKCVLGRWLIHLVGPGPSAGGFEPSTLTFAGEKGWEWTAREGKEKEFIKDEGKWVFFGRKPKFLWKSNVWSFVSNHPTLAFYVGSEATNYRMLCEQGNKLLIPGNSYSAKKLMPAIKETIQTSARFKGEDQKTSINIDKIFDGDNSTPEAALSDDEIMSMDNLNTEAVTGADEDLGWNDNSIAGDDVGVESDDVAGLLISEEETDGEDLDWSGVGTKPIRGTAIISEDSVQTVSLPGEVTDNEDDQKKVEPAAVSKSGKEWKQGKQAFEMMTLEFLVKSKNGVALIKPETVNLLETQKLEAVIDAAAGQFKLKDNLVIQVKLSNGKITSSEFEIQVEVLRIEGEPDEGRQITVFTLDEKAEVKINDILKTYLDRQGELMEFFQTAKGA
ncbi:MAG: hypothetical protein KA715_14700 [Xanthomonadaceae bacterium]|nr:hypothetical protein [Xanthomonadaceae bacterium]